MSRLIPDYINSLCEEIKATARIMRDMTLNTVYIGGGTPTILDNGQLDWLLGIVENNIDTSTLEEYTLEAGRPDTITREKFEVAKQYGVTRVSVNPQTLNDDILREIGRHHTVDDFFKAFAIFSLICSLYGAIFGL